MHELLFTNVKTALINIVTVTVRLVLRFQLQAALQEMILSPNEVFGDIMVLASPPRPPSRP